VKIGARPARCNLTGVTIRAPLPRPGGAGEANI